jgi:hypothetical protein
LGALAGCAAQEVDTRPDVLVGAFARQGIRVEIARYASDPTGFPGLVNQDLVSLDREAEASHRQLWVTLATSGFLTPVTAAQAREVGADLALDVAIRWVCRGSGGFGCDGFYDLTARDAAGRVAWKDRIPLGRISYAGGTTPDVFRLQAQHLMEDANRRALGRLKVALGQR